MSISHLVKTIQPRGLPYCSQLSELIKKLKPLKIDGMAYTVLQDTPDNSQIRSSFFYSSEQLLGSYINDIDNWKEEHFWENQKYPLNKTTFYRPEDPRYLTTLTKDSPMWKISVQHGIYQSFCVCLRDDLQKKSELFWFYTTVMESHWIMQQIENFATIKKFILYFKDEMESIVKTSLLSKEEWDYFSKMEMNKNLALDAEVQNLEQSIEIPLRKYHLDYPFSAPLSSKEFEVLKLYSSGYSAECAAQSLHVSKRTIEKHLENILSKSTHSSLKRLRVALSDCSLFSDLI
jgi:DNA-binding CsgD family transcriptional regulator